jgi:hypothetical protein
MAASKPRAGSATSPRATYLSVPDVARLLGWTTRATRKWLTKAGVLMRRGGRPVTTPERLHAEFPEVFQRLAASDEH